MDRSTLEKKQLVELREIASTLELSGYKRMRKADLVDLIVGADSRANGSGESRGAAGNGRSPASASTDGADAGSDTGDDADATDPSDATDTATRTADDAAESGAEDAGRQADAGDDATRKHEAVDHRRDAAASGGARSRARRRDGDTSNGEGAGRQQSNRDTTTQDTQSRRNDQDNRSRNDGNNGGSSRSKNRRRKGRGGNQGGNQGQSNQGQSNRSQSNQGGHNQQQQEGEVREGVLDLLPEGYGFLRVTSYLTGERDVYVSQNYVRRFGLRRGDRVSGPIRHNNRGKDKFPALARVDTIEGMTVDEHQQVDRPRFKDLTPLFPNDRLRLETEEASPVAMRIMDLMSPIGKGQRGLIVSPPKAGKTTILKQLARSIETNNPEVHLMVLLVDERPEEVTDFERSVNGEVISSTFDRPADDHTQVAELASERAMRLVERGRDVVILLDSITRLGRAYNLAAPASGRILSGGIDSAALYPPKRFFGAARNIEDGGSLTILASALIETGSKMDDVIFEEFKGTGNMELRLDRRMEQKRIFPAIDVQASGTRREELLLGKSELEIVWQLRRVLAQMDTGAALELLIDKLKSTRSNKQFLMAIAKGNMG